MQKFSAGVACSMHLDSLGMPALRAMVPTVGEATIETGLSRDLRMN
jgi:hypothetical protein